MSADKAIKEFMADLDVRKRSPFNKKDDRLSRLCVAVISLRSVLPFLPLYLLFAPQFISLIGFFIAAGSKQLALFCNQKTAIRLGRRG